MKIAFDKANMFEDTLLDLEQNALQLHLVLDYISEQPLSEAALGLLHETDNNVSICCSDLRTVLKSLVPEPKNRLRNPPQPDGADSCFEG